MIDRYIWIAFCGTFASILIGTGTSVAEGVMVYCLLLLVMPGEKS